jgi:hypothetical protein
LAINRTGMDRIKTGEVSGGPKNGDSTSKKNAELMTTASVGELEPRKQANPPPWLVVFRAA